MHDFPWLLRSLAYKDDVHTRMDFHVGGVGGG